METGPMSIVVDVVAIIGIITATVLVLLGVLEGLRRVL